MDELERNQIHSENANKALMLLLIGNQHCKCTVYYRNHKFTGWLLYNSVQGSVHVTYTTPYGVCGIQFPSVFIERYEYRWPIGDEEYGHLSLHTHWEDLK